MYDINQPKVKSESFHFSCSAYFVFIEGIGFIVFSPFFIDRFYSQHHKDERVFSR